MYPTAAQPGLRRSLATAPRMQDMTVTVEVATTSILLGATYWYLGFKPYRIERFVRSESATMFYKMTRTERDSCNTLLADPGSILYLKNYAEGCAALTALIRCHIAFPVDDDLRRTILPVGYRINDAGYRRELAVSGSP